MGKGEDEVASEAISETGWWRIQVGWGRTEKTGPGEALKIQVWRSGISALGGPGEKGFTRRGTGAKKRGGGAEAAGENGPAKRKRPRKKGREAGGGPRALALVERPWWREVLADRCLSGKRSWRREGAGRRRLGTLPPTIPHNFRSGAGRPIRPVISRFFGSGRKRGHSGGAEAAPFEDSQSRQTRPTARVSARCRVPAATGRLPV